MPAPAAPPTPSSTRTGTTRLAAHTARVRDDALAAFAAEHRELRLPPVVAVIACLDEAGAIADVVRAVPPVACGLEVATLVVDDGSSDGTGDAARDAGALVLRLERNCGHGIALRAGYRVAADNGARIVVTLDGDGQWNPAELPVVLAPVAAGEADFAIGSRVLGSSEDGQPFRSTGVRVFARLVQLLTGTHVTDTSSGFRAFTTDLATTVPQTQVQFQTSELLIGALLAGYRVVERPIVMRKRLAGHSKKGHDLLYGAHYAGVIVSTWWRERRR